MVRRIQRDRDQVVDVYPSDPPPTHTCYIQSDCPCVPTPHIPPCPLSQNLLIGLRRNEVKLSDFGLARAMGFPSIGCLSPEVGDGWVPGSRLI